MKKIYLILLIALTTCDIIDESFDDHIILEKSKEKTVTSLKPQTRHTTGVTSKYSTRYTSGITTKLSTKVKTPIIPRKTENHLKDIPIKGTSGLIKGKSAEKFRKLNPAVQKKIIYLKKNNKWNHVTRLCQTNVGMQSKPNNPCNDLSEEDCKQLMEFAC